LGQNSLLLKSLKWYWEIQKEIEMVLFKELFGTFAGQLSLAVILFIIGMAIFFVRMFLKKIAAGE
jgi:hypothetical protein